MKLKEIYKLLDSISPFELQESWDNSGVQVGSMDSQIRQIVVSLDIDVDMVEKHPEDTLFVIHHPPIFGKLSNLCFDHYPANLLQRVILKRDSVIAMHTNFDKTHLNRYVFKEVLGFTGDCEEFICRAEGNWTLQELESILKEAFGNDLRVVNPKEQINSIALTTGAGASFIDMVKADCFLTGDIKYHDAMKAESLDLMMVDIGHFASERYFVDAISKNLKSLPISVIISQSKNPLIKF